MNQTELRELAVHNATGMLGLPDEMELTPDEFERVIDITLKDEVMMAAMIREENAQIALKNKKTQQACNVADAAIDNRNNVCNLRFLEIASEVTGREIDGI